MPELPEVETVARQLAPRIAEQRVRRLVVLDSLLRRGPRPRLAGRRVVEVGRSGKQVLIGFSPRAGSRDPMWLLVHLRMTGRLLYVEGEGRGPREHLRARIDLERGVLLFVDTRRLGTLSWLRSREAAEPRAVDPLSPAFTPQRLAELANGSRQALKPWLLRQDRLVGLGNIYASEIAHAAELSPFRRVGSLMEPEIRRLHRATRRVLRRAIEHCGTTFSDFQDARGIDGTYQRFLRVYERAERPCPRCSAPVERRIQQQRSTFYCPACQR
jgi:formamidopyrimidine-DNA glycosylase